MAIFLGWASITQPARAFVPVAVLAAPQVVTASGSIAMGLLAGVVGLVGMYLEITDAQDNSIRVPLNSQNPAIIAPPPAPASTSTTSSTQYIYNSSSYSSLDSMCAAAETARWQWCYSLNTVWQQGPYTVTGAECKTSCCLSGGGCNYYVEPYSTSSTSSCPSGYTLNGSQCILDDARAVTPDKKFDYSRSNNQFAPASANDQDASTTPKHANTNGNVAVAGTSGMGESTQTIVKPLSNGGTQVITQIQRQSGALEQQVLSFSPDGQVIGFQVTESAAQLQVDPQTGTATVASPQPIMNPDGTTNTSILTQTPTSTSTATQAIQFPNDYNRESTQQDIRDKLANSQDVADPVQPSDSQFNDSFFKDTFAGLLAWQLPAHTSECPTGSFGWNDHQYTIDAHCHLIRDHWGLLSQAMAVVWIIVALFIVLRA